MQCNGKCYLAKQIKQQQEKEATETLMQLAQIEVVSLPYQFPECADFTFCFLTITYPFFSTPLIETCTSPLLKPPGTDLLS